MRRPPVRYVSCGLALAATLPAVLAACTYDFDRFGQTASDGGGEGGSAAGGSASAGAPPSGSTSAGASGAGRGGAGGASGAGRSGAGGAGSGGRVGDGGTGSEPVGGMSSGAGMGGRAGQAGVAGAAGRSGGGAGAAGSAGAATAGSGGSSGASFDCSKVAGTVWNERCYFTLGSARMSWEAAKAACAATASAHLVTVTSSAEQTMLERTFSGSSDERWIGLSLRETTDPGRGCRNDPESCPFLWVNGEALSYTNWARRSLDNEPNYTGACVRVQGDFSWADLDCTTELPAICER